MWFPFFFPVNNQLPPFQWDLDESTSTRREGEQSRKTLLKLLLYSAGIGSLWARQGPDHTSGADNCKISVKGAAQHELWGNFSRGKQSVKASETCTHRRHTRFPCVLGGSSHLFVQSCWAPAVKWEDFCGLGAILWSLKNISRAIISR